MARLDRNNMRDASQNQRPRPSVRKAASRGASKRVASHTYGTTSHVRSDARHLTPTTATRAKKPRGVRTKVALIAACLALVVGVGGTLAYLTSMSDNVKNTFTPTSTPGEIVEDFDGVYKEKVAVKNTSTDVPVYARVKFVSYVVDDAGKRLPDSIEVPSFNTTSAIAAGWEKSTVDQVWYYTKPLSAGATSPFLVPAYKEGEGESFDHEAMILWQSEDGKKKQVVEVLAQFVQAIGDTDKGSVPAVVDAWGNAVASVGSDGKLVLKPAA